MCVLVIFFLEELADICVALGHDKAQNIIDQITSAYESGGPPQGGFNFGPQHLGVPPPGFGGPPMAFGPPPPGFGARKYSSLLLSGRIYVNGHNVGPGPPGPPFPPGHGYPSMMPPGVPPFPPNGVPPPGVPPGIGFPPHHFPPPPAGTMPPFAPQNLPRTSIQMDRGSTMDSLREGDVAVRANGDANGDSTSQPVPPTIHPDRLRMMGSVPRP